MYIIYYTLYYIIYIYNIIHTILYSVHNIYVYIQYIIYTIIFMLHKLFHNYCIYNYYIGIILFTPYIYYTYTHRYYTRIILQ